MKVRIQTRLKDHQKGETFVLITFVFFQNYFGKLSGVSLLFNRCKPHPI